MELVHGQDYVGNVQFQFRGNVPSAYMHDPNKAFTVGGSVPKGGTVGLLATGLGVSRVYNMGLPQPFLMDVTPSTISPDFHGWLYTTYDSEIEQLKNLLDDKVCVTKKFLIGKGKINVVGYTLIMVGYTGEIGHCGSHVFGKTVQEKPRDCITKEEAIKLLDNGLAEKNHVNFALRFMLKDPERPIMNRWNTGNLHPSWKDHFHPHDLMEVALACTCNRMCRGSIGTTDNTPKKTYVCRCPLYATPVGGKVRAAKVGERNLECLGKDLPSEMQVVMHLGRAASSMI